jgi:hypothetical protein
MSTGNGKTASAEFSRQFDKITPLIHEEWPDVDAEALKQTKGDYDLVVTLIAKRTEHTKTLVKKQLEELQRVADGGDRADDMRLLRQMLERLQARTQEASNFVRGRMTDDAKQKVTQNPLVTLLIAIGLGFLLGFVLRGRGRRHGGRS